MRRSKQELKHIIDQYDLDHAEQGGFREAVLKLAKEAGHEGALVPCAIRPVVRQHRLLGSEIDGAGTDPRKGSSGSAGRFHEALIDVVAWQPDGAPSSLCPPCNGCG